MMDAIRLARYDYVDMFLAQKDVLADWQCREVLVLLLENNQLERAKVLLQTNVIFSVKDLMVALPEHESLLHYAHRRGDKQLADLLESRDADPALVCHGQTPNDVQNEMTEYHSFLANLTSQISQKMHGTNSAGVCNIWRSLTESNFSEPTELINLANKIKAIAKERITGSSLSLRYCHSAFFGNGRHANVEKLYQKLAVMNVSDQRSRDEITQFIDNTSFVHG